MYFDNIFVSTVNTKIPTRSLIIKPRSSCIHIKDFTINEWIKFIQYIKYSEKTTIKIGKYCTCNGNFNAQSIIQLPYLIERLDRLNNLTIRESWPIQNINNYSPKDLYIKNAIEDYNKNIKYWEKYLIEDLIKIEEEIKEKTIILEKRQVPYDIIFSYNEPFISFNLLNVNGLIRANKWLNENECYTNYGAYIIIEKLENNLHIKLQVDLNLLVRVHPDPEALINNLKLAFILDRNV